MKPPLTAKDYDRAAERLKCDPAAIEAVAAVESRGAGFNPDESPKTLFEGHHFHKYTGGKFDQSNPLLSFPKANRDLYGRTWQDEAWRLAEARKLDDTAALLSTSWGRFQIMGFNHKACGYPTVQEFVAAMAESEAKHLDAFVSFIMGTGLDSFLRMKEWAGFAQRYNGPGYKANRYDEKMAAAHQLAAKQRAA